MRTFRNLTAFADAAGEELGTSGWVELDQERIDRFAAATGDHQWIHVDPDRASTGPFGTTIAHGFLTLSLLPQLLHDIYAVEGISMAVNYGLDKVRFPAPVPAGSQVRGVARLTATTQIPGGVQGQLSTTIEIEDAPKPACVVDSIVRYLA